MGTNSRDSSEVQSRPCRRAQSDRPTSPREALTEASVLRARFAYVAGRDSSKPYADRVTVEDVADFLDCSTSTAYKLLTGETYQWVGGPLYDPSQFDAEG